MELHSGQYDTYFDNDGVDYGSIGFHANPNGPYGHGSAQLAYCFDRGCDPIYVEWESGWACVSPQPGQHFNRIEVRPNPIER